MLEGCGTNSRVLHLVEYTQFLLPMAGDRLLPLDFWGVTELEKCIYCWAVSVTILEPLDYSYRYPRISPILPNPMNRRLG